MANKKVYNVGINNRKYPTKINGKNTKEYSTWQDIIKRCFDKRYKEKHPTYKNITCCEDWLLFENFYEWIHNQKNFNKWLNGKQWNVDKDILIKGNEIYSPTTCCLVPSHVNKLFVKSNSIRGTYPVGVSLKKQSGKYQAQISQVNSQTNKKKTNHLGYYNTPEEAFQIYKVAKEEYIKQVAQEEYDNGNITKTCYEAMMNYEVEITD